MRVVVTGAGNPQGAAIVDAMVEKGYSVRIFGVEADVAARWGDKVQWFPGHVATVGSIEPVLAEREVLVHAAGLDEPGKDKQAHAFHIERSTLGARYGAERELLDQFIHIAPAAGAKGVYQAIQEGAIQTVQATRRVDAIVVHAREPAATAAEVISHIENGKHMGRMPGRENDALVQ